MKKSTELIEKLFDKCYKGEFCCTTEAVLFLYDSDEKCKALLDSFIEKINNYAIQNNEKPFKEDRLISDIKLACAVKHAAFNGLKSDKEKSNSKLKIIEELTDATNYYNSQTGKQPTVEQYFRYLLSTEDAFSIFYNFLDTQWDEDNICYDFADQLYDELCLPDLGTAEQSYGEIKYSPEVKPLKIKKPVTKIQKPIYEEDIAKKIQTRIVGQDYAIQTISKSLLAPANGFKNQNAPTLGAFLLAGAPGIGKTEIAKAIADLMFDGRLCIVRGGDFSGETSITTLTGAGAGLVGYGEPNPIEQKLKQWGDRPGVVLIDEFDQAHPSIMRWLYSILDEGRFNAQAKTNSVFGNEYQTVEVSLKNALIILTSNLGMDKTRLGFKLKGTEQDENNERISEIVKSGTSCFIPKALFDRVKIIPMSELSEEEKQTAVKRICKITAQNLQKAITEKLNQIKKLQDQIKVKVAILPETQKQLLKLSHGSLRGVKHLLNDDIYNLVLSSALRTQAELKSSTSLFNNITFNVKQNNDVGTSFVSPFIVSTQKSKK